MSTDLEISLRVDQLGVLNALLHEWRGGRRASWLPIATAFQIEKEGKKRNDPVFSVKPGQKAPYSDSAKKLLQDLPETLQIFYSGPVGQNAQWIVTLESRSTAGGRKTLGLTVAPRLPSDSGIASRGLVDIRPVISPPRGAVATEADSLPGSHSNGVSTKTPQFPADTSPSESWAEVSDEEVRQVDTARHPPLDPFAIVPPQPELVQHLRPPALPKLEARNNMVWLSSLEDRFIARTGDLWAVHDAITAHRRAIVTGTGGVGKTQLAIEYLWRFGHYYPGGVFWVEAERGRGEMVANIARAAGIPIDRDLKQETDRVGMLWRMLTGPPVLIVIDNFPEHEFPRDWFTSVDNISFLITSQRSGMVPEGEVPLTCLTTDESLAILNSWRGPHREYPLSRLHTIDEAADLIELLDGLPLALELARGYLDAQPSLPIEKFVSQLREVEFGIA